MTVLTEDEAEKEVDENVGGERDMNTVNKNWDEYRRSSEKERTEENWLIFFWYYNEANINKY